MTGSAVVAILFPNFQVGGVQRVLAQLAAGLAARGHGVDALALDPSGPLGADLPQDVRIVPLARSGSAWTRWLPLRADPGGVLAMLRPILLPRRTAPELAHLQALAGYLARVRPDALLAAKPYPNLLALWARRLAGASTRIVISEHSALRRPGQEPPRQWRNLHVRDLQRRAYPWADAVVAVSAGLAEDLAQAAGLPRDRIATIFNPVIPPDLEERLRQPADHPWLAERTPPVILSVGRLDRSKDQPTLLRAFARVRAQRLARLLILGAATDPKETETRRAALLGLARTLGIAEAVALPGAVGNPFPYYAKAALFVLSSRYEGFGNALAEALACGCPVVGTDCPVGPREILDDGRYGALVPVGDDRAMAAAIIEQLDHPPPPAMLRARGRSFSVEAAVASYAAVLLPSHRPRCPPGHRAKARAQ